MFNLWHEYYLFNKNRLSFLESNIFILKLFYNMMIISLMISLPIVLIQYLVNIISVN